MSKKGIFIVLEGTDGSGKTTQFKLLVCALKRAKKPVMTIDFPQYGKPSAYFVEQYLNGKFGSASRIGPYQGSLFYALDRCEAAPRIRQWLKQGKMVVANRYTSSNAGHQGGKILNTKARQAYWKWLFDLEYKLLKIPKPNLTILLHMPAEQAQLLVDKKTARKYVGGKKRDIHEADLGHLRAAERAYLEVAHICKFSIVECFEQGKLLTPQQIHFKVYKIVKNLINKNK
jgi:dTMP kinase